jgi:hypothetical protein
VRALSVCVVLCESQKKIYQPVLPHGLDISLLFFEKINFLKTMVHKIIKIAYISFSNFSNVLKRYPYISTYHYIILFAITYTPFIYINIFIHFALHPHTRLAFCLIESLV